MVLQGWNVLSRWIIGEDMAVELAVSVETWRITVGCVATTRVCKQVHRL